MLPLPVHSPAANGLHGVLHSDVSCPVLPPHRLQKEVGSLSLKMPALEKKVESSALGSGTEVGRRRTRRKTCMDGLAG